MESTCSLKDFLLLPEIKKNKNKNKFILYFQLNIIETGAGSASP